MHGKVELGIDRNLFNFIIVNMAGIEDLLEQFTLHDEDNENSDEEHVSQSSSGS